MENFFKNTHNAFEEQDLLRTLITHTEDFVYIKDQSSRFLISNMVTAKIMGAKSPEELIGKTDFDFYPQEFAASFYADEQKIVKTGMPIINIEEPGIDHDGHMKYFFTTKVPIKNKEGQVIGIIGIGKDITLRKQAEEVLKRDKETLETLAQKRADEIVEIKMQLEKTARLSDIGLLAATVAHELRNPLATIRLVLANIKKKMKDPVLDDYLGMIENKVSESDQIINNLLFYSRIRTPHLENIVLNQIVKECADLLTGRSMKLITLVNHFESMKHIVIKADPIQMREIFHNLLNNAYDAVEKGGTVEVGCEIQGKYLHAYVKDNGIGMDEEDLKKVFDAFYTTKSKGTGLGLSVCRQIINLHGGTINIQSKKSKGTCVNVTLPIS